MLQDIVIDTNVLVHASNSNVPQSRYSLMLIDLLMNSTTILRTDPGFDIDLSRNRSRIGYEYFKHLHHGMIGFSLVSSLAANKRVRPVSRRVPPQVSRFLRTMNIPPSDCIFVKVAHNSLDKTLSSHDETHFPEHTRDQLSERLHVTILEAVAVLPLIS